MQKDNRRRLKELETQIEEAKQSLLMVEADAEVGAEGQVSLPYPTFVKLAQVAQ